MLGAVTKPEEVTISVYPSGADFATNSAPITPFAPGLFSTTKGWPICWVSCAPSSRARASGPPGPKGTMMRTGLPG